uniref:Uncharacterized protein n=1 Tax=Eptatretus burgeri TaxID=7764 RepID=A0A8C4X0K0_EPTBU
MTAEQNETFMANVMGTTILPSLKDLSQLATAEVNDLYQIIQQAEQLQTQVAKARKQRKKEQCELDTTRQNQERLQAAEQERHILEDAAAETEKAHQELQAALAESWEQQHLLVAFPELHRPSGSQAESTGDVVLDMERQLQANGLRMRWMQAECQQLQQSLCVLRQHQQDGTLKVDLATQHALWIAWLTTPSSGRRTGARGRPFTGIAEQKRGALTKCQRRPSPPDSARHEQEPASVHGAAKRESGVDGKRWMSNVGEREVGVERQ